MFEFLVLNTSFVVFDRRDLYLFFCIYLFVYLFFLLKEGNSVNIKVLDCEKDSPELCHSPVVGTAFGENSYHVYFFILSVVALLCVCVFFLICMVHLPACVYICASHA